MTKSAVRSQAAVEGAESASIVASSHDAIIGTNAAGVISSCNPAAARMFGLKPENIIGRPLSSFIPCERHAEEASIARRILTGEVVGQYRTERIGPDGTVICVSSSVSPIEDSDGVIVGVASVSRRIGEWQQVHDRFELDTEGHLAGAQDAAEEIQGRVSRRRAEAQQAAERFEVQADLEREQAIAAARRFEEQADRERERADAQRDREQLQGQLQQNQRLEVLGQLAGGVAHDFNNLLAVILNYAAFVVEELNAGLGSDLAAAARDVGQIQRAAQRATALTHQLLAFARREVVQPRVLDINDVVTEVQQLLERTIGEDVMLSTALADNLWPVMADAGQLEQVLVNLAVNARDAMHGGGTLSIDTANVMVDADFIAAGSTVRPGRHVRLRVGDTGTGMPAEVVEHVFEPFYTTKADGSGTGLGLATVYGIVVQAEATIDIHSRPGVGTTFTIMVPVTDEVAVPIEDEKPSQRTPTGETILVVEDEEALREVTDRIFTRSGYRVLTAANGPDALDLAARHDGEIHLLVTDVVMPNMLGKEVAENLSKLRPAIKVLYMSGYAQPVLASQGRLDPGVNLVEKPFSAATLVDKAGQILNG